MKPKKTKKADLNNYSFTFMLIGMVVIMLVTLKVINMKSYAGELDLGSVDSCFVDMDKTELISIEEPKPKMKMEKPKELVQLKIEKDDENIKESLFKSTEITDLDSIIDITEIDSAEVEEGPDISVPFTLVEQVPVFPGCDKYVGDNKALRKCMNDKINKLVARKFDTGLAEDLGLSGERVRILTQFTIDKNGSIIDIKTRSKYRDLENEARRVIREFPRMKPGKQRNIPVKVTYTLPIVFYVADE